MTSTYTVTAGSEAFTTDDWMAADTRAAELLLAGAPCVDVFVVRHSPTVWDQQGRHLGEPALLQRFCPAVQSVAPSPCWSTSAFAPFRWREFAPAMREALAALA